MTDLIEGEPVALTKRCISAETCRHFRYLVGEQYGRPVQLATYCDETGVPVAQKVRTADKKFSWVGDPSAAGLYGQHLWKTGGRKLVITEGEIDALSMSQVQGNKWPVVSVPNGAQGAAKTISEQIAWVEGFDEVIFLFDMDPPGRAAAKECAELLTPGKARIAELPRKDANEMLVAGEADKLVAAMWSAKVYRPDGIVAGADLWELLRKEEVVPSLPYPWPDLNEKTRGLRTAEVVTWCAGTGVGKSTACRELATDLVLAGETVGYIALEETVRRTALGFMSIHLNRPLHLGYGDVTEEQLHEAFEKTVGSGRVFLYDHFGSMESDNLYLKIRQMVRGFGVRWIVLDHVSIVVSGMESENERKDIDILMTRLRSLAQELNIGVIVVSHLKRKDGKSHEEGGTVSLSDLRGSQSIAQLSDIVIGLERDQQAAEGANIARVRVLKNRWTGECGLAGGLAYNKQTGRLTEAEPLFGDEGEGGNERPRRPQHDRAEF